jgi:hypothetical protein
MSRKEKLLFKARNNSRNFSFGEFQTLLMHCGWNKDHQTGSHQIWRSLYGRRISIQNKNGAAKEFTQSISILC